jgi:hypothetical protein
MKKIMLYLILIIIAYIGVDAFESSNTSINDYAIDKTNLELKDNLKVNKEKGVKKFL